MEKSHHDENAGANCQPMLTTPWHPSGRPQAYNPSKDVLDMIQIQLQAGSDLARLVYDGKGNSPEAHALATQIGLGGSSIWT